MLVHPHSHLLEEQTRKKIWIPINIHDAPNQDEPNPDYLEAEMEEEQISAILEENLVRMFHPAVFYRQQFL
ncbi:Hypothetical predicted protein [Cloeon dipterum]|uniref:Uncharacterized protein n=1 Tax=Cloeon dipterum TaxID=197152 RepID=A0A8S1DJ92_9INSE|nr:Hypothetical predicted protein [Cloeon dipterum]